MASPDAGVFDHGYIAILLSLSTTTALNTLSPEAPGEALSIDLFFIRINTLKDGTTFPFR